MQKPDKKLVIFKFDLEDNTLKNKCFVKFLDKENNYAIFYKPLIAPKNFKEYLKENSIVEAYIITNDSLAEKYKDFIYTFENDKGVYRVTQGIEKKKKLVLLVDKGMEICLNLPKYLYEVNDNKIYLSNFKEGKNKNYCYVIDDENVNNILKNIMIETEEIVPGILNFGTYNIEKNIIKSYKK